MLARDVKGGKVHRLDEIHVRGDHLCSPNGLRTVYAERQYRPQLVSNADGNGSATFTGWGLITASHGK